jgi:hypothetical protein
MSSLTRIALAGGPCSGKSSALEFLQTKLAHQGVQVYCAPEVVTLLFHAGIQFEGGDREKEFAYQLSVCRLQMALEANLTRIAESRLDTYPKSVLIMDHRGILDNKGYMDAAMWQQLLDNLHKEASDSGKISKGLTEADILARYEGILHLVTAADGAEAFYKSGETTDDSGTDVLRRETPEQARALDQTMWEVWKGHPHHVKIRNVGNFKDKLEATAQAVLELVEHKI